MTREELIALLEERILGPGHRTSEEVVAPSGGTEDDANELWTALGFPPASPSERTFTDADAEVLANVMAFRILGFATPEVIVPMTRVLGQALSRVATAQVQAFHDPLVVAIDQAEQGELDNIEAITDLLVPGFEQFVNYVWRRHLVAAIRRDLVEERDSAEIVGFADLVGYTRETRDLDDAGLSDLLGRFQTVATEQVAAAGARHVKGLGDGVMFAARTPAAAAEAALGLADACAADPRLPDVRVGLAHGHVVELEGDLYGPTVNRASRLADLARPGTVLADHDAAEQIAALASCVVKRTRPHKLKGLGEVPTSVIRRAEPGPTAGR